MSHLAQAIKKDGRPYTSFPTYDVVHDDGRVIGQIQAKKSMEFGYGRSRAEAGPWIAWLGPESPKEETRMMRHFDNREAAVEWIDLESE